MKIGLIHVGGSLSFSMIKLVKILSNKQKYYSFEIAAKPIWVTLAPRYFIQASDGTGHIFYDPENLIEFAISSAINSYDYIIAITGLRLAKDYVPEDSHIKRWASNESLPDLDYFSIENVGKKASVITVSNYYKYCMESNDLIYEYLVYLIVSTLLILRTQKYQINILEHDFPKGCIGDYCDDQKEILQSIRWARICRKCRNDLKRAMLKLRIENTEKSLIKGKIDKINIDVKNEFTAIENLLLFVNKSRWTQKSFMWLKRSFFTLLGDTSAILILGIIASQIGNLLNKKALFIIFTTALLIIVFILHFLKEKKVSYDADPPN
jgi:hypothetical protein